MAEPELHAYTISDLYIGYISRLSYLFNTPVCLRTYTGEIKRTERKETMIYTAGTSDVGRSRQEVIQAERRYLGGLGVVGCISSEG